ncbi:hypothetical protein CIPAW_01G211200 [Carya illinoinensis]|uniref:Uncharacterized protein n=1 Tax=Carya illinoinensis TaxID=32201 RepID=A0A8T1RQH8_CARIL|nr:hypothetical protein CIPAW_01G211200 [Carya illinoinensis]
MRGRGVKIGEVWIEFNECLRFKIRVSDVYTVTHQKAVIGGDSRRWGAGSSFKAGSTLLIKTFLSLSFPSYVARVPCKGRPILSTQLCLLSADFPFIFFPEEFVDFF